MQKNIFKFLALLIAFTCILLVVKKMQNSENNASTKIETEANYDSALPDDFHTFYDMYHTDSIFQMKRTVFPLKGIARSSDSTKVAEKTIWQAEDWVIHRPFDNQNGAFERVFTSIEGLVTEQISANNGLFTLEKRYAKLSGEWHLIYYQELLMLG